MERMASEPFHGFRFEGIRYDCGSKQGFLEATVAFAMARPDLADTMYDIVERAAGAGRSARLASAAE